MTEPNEPEAPAFTEEQMAAGKELYEAYHQAVVDSFGPVAGESQWDSLGDGQFVYARMRVILHERGVIA